MIAAIILVSILIFSFVCANTIYIIRYYKVERERRNQLHIAFSNAWDSWRTGHKVPYYPILTNLIGRRNP